MASRRSGLKPPRTTATSRRAGRCGNSRHCANVSSADRVFGALSDPTRRAILDLLREHQEMTAGDIAGRFQRISRPAVSKHLRVLREAGLVHATEHAAVRTGTASTLDHWPKSNDTGSTSSRRIGSTASSASSSTPSRPCNDPDQRGEAPSPTRPEPAGPPRRPRNARRPLTVSRISVTAVGSAAILPGAVGLLDRFGPHLPPNRGFLADQGVSEAGRQRRTCPPPPSRVLRPLSQSARHSNVIRGRAALRIVQALTVGDPIGQCSVQGWVMSRRG